MKGSYICFAAVTVQGLTHLDGFGFTVDQVNGEMLFLVLQQGMFASTTDILISLILFPTLMGKIADLSEMYTSLGLNLKLSLRETIIYVMCILLKSDNCF